MTIQKILKIVELIVLWAVLIAVLCVTPTLLTNEHLVYFDRVFMGGVAMITEGLSLFILVQYTSTVLEEIGE